MHAPRRPALGGVGQASLPKRGLLWKSLWASRCCFETGGEYRRVLEATARVAAILAHLAVLIGLILIGHRHFGNRLLRLIVIIG